MGNLLEGFPGALGLYSVASSWGQGQGLGLSGLPGEQGLECNVLAALSICPSRLLWAGALMHLARSLGLHGLGGQVGGHLHPLPTCWPSLAWSMGLVLGGVAGSSEGPYPGGAGIGSPSAGQWFP